MSKGGEYVSSDDRQVSLADEWVCPGRGKYSIRGEYPYLYMGPEIPTPCY